MKTYGLLFLSICFSFSFMPPADEGAQDILSNPFDLQAYKRKRGQSNSGGAPRKPYYFKPDTVGMYYRFFLFRRGEGYMGEDPEKRQQISDGPEIITYKPKGPYQYDFLDPTETLIQITVVVNEKELPELAFIGFDSTTIKKKLGDTFIRKGGCFIYTRNNNALVLKIEGRYVKWLKFVRLNFTPGQNNIPDDLVSDNLKFEKP